MYGSDIEFDLSSVSKTTLVTLEIPALDAHGGLGNILEDDAGDTDE
jgi:hypothetical protein